MAALCQRKLNQWDGQSAYTFTADPAPEPTIRAGWRRRDDGALVIEADRLGFAPLFIATGKDGRICAVSESATACARVIGAGPDFDAISVFLQVGFLVENDTPFENVRALAPGERLVVAADGDVLEHHTAPVLPATAKGLSQSEVVETYGELTRRAVEARMSSLPAEAFAVPLSGGRDSRHIFLQLLASGRKPDFAITHFAMPPQRGEDVRVAGLLAERGGVEHRVSRLDSERFFRDAARKNARLDFHTDEHHWFLPFAEHLGREATGIMDGLCGDALINCAFQRKGMVEALRAGDTEKAARCALSPSRALTFLAPRLAAEVSYDRAVARFARALAPLADRPDPQKEIQVWYKTRREIGLAPMKLMSPLFETISLPFIDAAVVDFALSLPYEEFGQPGIHDAVLKAQFPDFADIPFEQKGTQERFEKGESRNMLRDFWALRREWGAGQFEAPGFVLRRRVQSALKPDVNAHFWWMYWILWFRNFERTLESMGTGLLPTD